MKSKAWTQQEIDYLNENYGKILVKEIAEKLNRTIPAILQKVFDLNKKNLELKLYDKILKSNIPNSRETHLKIASNFIKELINTAYLPSKELAYILGVLNGDGNLSERRIMLISIDKDFSLNFKAKLEKWSGLKAKIYKYFNTKSHHYTQGFHYETILNSIEAREFLMQFYISKNEKAIDKIRKFLNSRDLQIAFIEGFFDSEGYYNKNNPRIYFANTNYNLILLTKEYLNFLGINTKIYEEKRKEGIILGKKCRFKKCYRLYIQYKEGINKFFKIFKPSIKRKQDKILAKRTTL